jgi:D-alanyl-D-alanine carboxypeptidase
MKKKQIAIFVILIAVVVAGFWWLKRDDSHKTTSSTTNKNSSQSATDTNSGTTAAGFDKSTYSLTDPTSIWVIANKQRPLNPKTYAPSDLVVPNIPLRSNITSTEKQVRQPMAMALETMVAAAKTEGLSLNLQSGYRSYSFQVSLYNRYVQQQGQAVADSQSARPGYSEHQTGLAADLGSVSHPECDVEACFGTTLEGKWLAANAYKYGFIIRYPQGLQNITGYIYEPWHVRYIGVDLATELHDTGVQTLEQFFGTGAAADY